LKTIGLYLFGLIILNCQATDLENRSSKTTMFQSPKIEYKVALNFINVYLNFVNDFKTEVKLMDWINNRNDVTVEFKNELKTILVEAYTNNHEDDLGFDPILDAQDSPNKFELDQTNGEYLIVKGENWPDFRLTLKLKLKDGTCLVDGAGIVNVPENRRIKR